ncbi:MAG TPA: FHA domain-containing protein [Acidobacteriota bacterium]|nr:FHA domain-containing protein [Acidobacteriota bacterium]
MVTVPSSRMVLTVDSCTAERFDEAYLHCIKGEGLQNGFFSYAEQDVTRFLIIKDGGAFCAAWDDGVAGNATLLCDFFEPFLLGPRDLECHDAPVRLLDAMATAWQRTPDAHVSPGVIAPQIMVESMLGSGREAAIRLRRPGSLDFVLIDKSRVQEYYAAGVAPPRSDPYNALLESLGENPEEISLDIHENPEAARSEDWAPVPTDFQEGMVRFYCHTSPHLVLTLGGREVRRYPLTSGRITIGRDPVNDIMIDNLSVSRRHAIITFADGLCMIEDAGSSNGTFIEGERILAPTTLADGQEATIGKHSVRFFTRSMRRDIGASPAEAMDQTVFMRSPQFESFPQKRLPHLTLGGKSIPVEKTAFSIGSNPNCDLVVEGRGVRSRHMELKRGEGDQVFAVHTGGLLSATRVNGKKVKHAPLQSGDLLQIGSVVIRYHLRTKDSGKA